MSQIEPYRSTTPARGTSRRTGRVLARIDEHTSVRAAEIESQAEVQAAKVDAIGGVTHRAMQATALLSQLEGQLGQSVPLAVTRLQALGDLGALAIGDVLSETPSRLRRL